MCKGYRVPSQEDTSRVIYISSQHTGNAEENEFLDKLYSRLVTGDEDAPVALYLIFPQLLNNDFQVSGKVDHYCALKLLSKCDELWVMYNRGITDEMAEEIRFAMSQGIPVRYRQIEFVDVEPDDIELENLQLLDKTKTVPGK